MDRYPVEPPVEDLSAKEKAPRRTGIILAVAGALLITLAVLAGWPAV